MIDYTSNHVTLEMDKILTKYLTKNNEKFGYYISRDPSMK